jgi:hypothetical protein
MSAATSALDLARARLPLVTDGPNRLTRLLTRPGTAFALLGGFYLVMLGLQVALQTGGRNDDAELLLFAQDLQLGYDAKNPPLVVWLGWAAMQAVGPGLLAVRAVVLGSLFLTYVFLWLAACEVCADRRLAVLAGLMPATMLYTAWTPFINMTHTLLLGCLVAASLWAALAYLRRPGALRAAGLGLAVGLGLLAKYNFALFLGGLALAALAVPAARRAMLDRRFVPAPLVALALALPHYIWFAGSLGAARAALEDKWGLDAALPYGERLLQGLGSVAQGSLSFLTPMLVLVALVFWYALRPGRPKAAAEAAAEAADLTAGRQVAGLAQPFVLALFGLTVLLGATDFATHHFFVLIGVPVWLFARIDLWRRRGGGLRAWSLNLTALSVAGCLAAVFVAYFGWMAQTALGCSKCGQVLPYGTYADGLRAAGFDPGTVLAVGGLGFMPAEQLRTVMPEARYRRPDDPLKAAFRPPANPTPGDCVVVWHAERHESMPQSLREGMVPGLPRLPETAVFGTIGGALAWSGRPAPPLGYALVEGGWGDCR